jgi:ABC-type multidrug transport system ATPase subunit/pSer/pThr/pTyr-binding forkhead associated (FHA) protein
MVAWLVGEAGELKDRKLPIDGPLVVLGRDRDACDVVLSQAFISKRQVAFGIDENGRIIAKHLGSKSSTYVNGRPISEQVLSDGDRIGFGPSGVLSFTFRTSPALSSPDLDAVRDDGRKAEHSRAESELVTNRRDGHEQLRKAVAPDDDHKAILRIGRAAENDIILDAPGVSRYHATLTYGASEQPVLEDLTSTNGTYVNGSLLTESRTLTSDDLVFLGGFVLRINGREVQRLELRTSRICAEGISKSIGGKILLQNITLALLPREFIGIMGSSGCGKSTLMDALDGLRPATTGSVSVNGLDLYTHFNVLRRSLGYVPQRDILHEALTVERTLWFASKLKLPPTTSAEEIRRIVNDVIETVGLRGQRSNEFRQLSGGEQKRLSLAVELITKPSFLFLDEPTSPLDPETTESMMDLFRRLADQGRIVVMVTHKFEKFHEMDNVAILTRGGYLAFFGPPRASLEYFNCSEPADIYRHISRQDPEELSARFRVSPEYHRYITQRVNETRSLQKIGDAIGQGTQQEPSLERPVGISQWKTLTKRFLEIKLNDRKNTLLLLIQAPLVAFILTMITGRRLNDAKTLFVAAVVALWFGANNAVRDIVAEAPIYTRERRFSLKIPSYVLSKFAVLSGIAVVQVLLFLAVLIGFKRLSTADLPSLFVVVYLTTLGGISTALFLSAVVNSTEKALSVLPLIVIPQLLLSGFLKPINDIYVDVRNRRPATVQQFQTAQLLRPLHPNMPSPIQKYSGLGPARYVSALMLARWSVDGLVHVVSVKDEQARDRLATQMWVHSHPVVTGAREPEDIEDAYRNRLRVDVAILLGFNLVLLSLTMLALKKKDVI